jgi:uncharacterized caspase-like protein
MSYRLLLKIAALASTCWMTIGDALAENRIALVIGNSAYQAVTALPNPANDAKAMTRFLSSAGFQVLQAPNLTQGDMRKTLSDFASVVAEKGPDTIALVFYAGHGLQVDGENYLIPVDARINREADVPLQATRLADVMNALASVPTKARFVFMDACRNNPFSEINKTTGRGLAIVDAPNGSLVSYSTAPGTEALDGDGMNSPYTSALIKIGQEPGLPIEQALKRVRVAVSDATNRQQFPWESSSLTGEFSFFPDQSKASERPKVASAAPADAPVATRSEARSVESWQKELKAKTPRVAYETVVREDKVEAYQAYLALYPSQSMAPVVRTIVERRRVMVAWHEAITINTVASYQAFLTGYGTTEFAGTANRLLDRARTRSVGNALAAFASVGPTCPCSQPTNTTPAPRGQKRTDVSPSGNPTGGRATTTTTTTTTTTAAVGTPVVTPVPVYDPPVRVHVRPDWRRPHKGPRYPGGDKPWKDTGGDKPKYPGGDKPKYPGGDKPKFTGGDKPKFTGGDKPSRGIGTVTSNRFKAVKPMRPATTTGMAPRTMTVNRGMGMGRPMMGRTGGFGRMGGTGGFGRMGGFGRGRMF